jgi:alkylation response protein AidB-like acyl-CoA dehydrogenase
LELLLKLFQITRMLVYGFALGATDTMLRLATAFARDRLLYRKAAADLPHVREKLIGAWLDLLAADALVRMSARALHVVPEQCSVVSLIAKIIAPELSERAAVASSEVLGARAYLREGPRSGVRLEGHRYDPASRNADIDTFCQTVQYIGRVRREPVAARRPVRACGQPQRRG